MSLEVGTNAYLDANEASAYFEGRPHADAWTEANSAQRDAALIHATRRIDALPLQGAPLADDQALAFPRDYQGEAPQVVPREVLDATCEEALALLERDTDRARLQRQGVTAFSLGKLSESYAASANPERLAAEARRLLARHLLRSVAIQ